MTKREHIRYCVLQKPYFTKETFKELRTYMLMAKASRHRNGKLVVEIIDGKTVDIMKREKQEDEGYIQ